MIDDCPVCDCGRPGIKKHANGWVCIRCRRIELKINDKSQSRRWHEGVVGFPDPPEDTDGEPVDVATIGR